MPEYSYSYNPLPETSYTVPDFSSFFFNAPSIEIPTIPIFSPISVPDLPALPTLEELGLPADPYDIYVPYVAPTDATYAQQQEALRLQFDLTNALIDLSVGYQLALENRQILDDYNTQLASLQGELDARKTALTSAQSTLSQNAADLAAATTEYQSKVTALDADAQRLSAAQTELNDAISGYNARLLVYEGQQAALADLSAQIETATTDRDALIAERDQLRLDMSLTEGQLASLDASVVAARSAVETAQADITRLNAEVAAAETSVTALTAQRTSLQTEVDALNETYLAEAARAAALQASLQTMADQQAAGAEALAETNRQLAMLKAELMDAENRFKFAEASYALLQEQIAAGTAPGSTPPELASSDVRTPEFVAQSESAARSFREAQESLDDINRILRNMLGILKSAAAAFLGIWSAVTNLGKKPPTQQQRPTSPGSVLPRPGQRVYYAGFPPIPGVPDWATGLGYGLALVALILMGAKLAKDQAEKKSVANK